MNEIYNINSILNAVNEINTKKKKISNVSKLQNSTPKIDKNLIVPLDIDKIIREAEEYKNKSTFKVNQPDKTENKSDKIKTKNHNKTFEDTQTQITDDLLLKIKDLENQLESFHIKKKQTLNNNTIILKDEFVESLKESGPSIIKLNEVLSKNKNFLKDEIVTSLQIQDSTIDILNEKIKKFINTEKRLRSQLIDLEQDKSILLKKAEKFEEVIDYKKIINDTKEILKTIHRKVAKQKKIFLALKNYSIKTERDFSFYKENYEKLIIENDDIKKKLSNTKQQVEAFEEIKKELAYTFENFNNVLSKNSIIKFNESFSKITSSLVVPGTINKKNK